MCATCPDMVFRNSEEFVLVELLVVRQMFQGSDAMMFTCWFWFAVDKYLSK